MYAALWAGAFLTGATAAEPAPDFQLRNHNPNTAHGTNLVSPRDYLHQVSAYYFAASNCSYCRSQLSYLNELRGELRSSNSPVSIEILGVNDTTASTSFQNSLITAGRTMAWLQDTPEAAVGARWNVEYRDVVILDSSNRVAAVFNLNPPYDLAQETNRTALKNLLLTVANSYDSDGDRLPDHWENTYFRRLAHGGEVDSDGDGVLNRAEFLLGSNPNDSNSVPLIRATINDASRFTATFHRWGGKMGAYQIGSSTDLGAWAGTNPLIVKERNLVDGTGRFEVTASFDASIVNQGTGFIRLNATPLP